MINFSMVDAQKYTQLKYLDRGAHGQCYLYERADDALKTKVVIKRIPSDCTPEQQEEAKVLMRCRHPLVIGFYEAFCEDNMFYIVMQYAEGGNLGQFIKERRSTTPFQFFNEIQVLNYFTQITMALDYLHKNKVIHRDLKPDNVLLNRTRTLVKLADFGISKIIGENLETRTFIGTSYYVAPEMYNGEPYDHLVDVWALGCVLYELSELEKAFIGPQSVLPTKINKADYAIPTHIKDPYLLQIVNDCLTVSKDLRPLPETILRSPPVMATIAKLVCQIEICMPVVRN